jgi:hypothetical protein
MESLRTGGGTPFVLAIAKIGYDFSDCLVLLVAHVESCAGSLFRPAGFSGAKFEVIPWPGRLTRQ